MAERRQDKKGIHSDSGYERRDVDIKKVLYAGGIICGILVILIILLNEMFMVVKEDIYYQQVLNPESKRLARITAREDSVLNSYGIIDEEAGKYRMPIEKAIELVVEEAENGNRR